MADVNNKQHKKSNIYSSAWDALKCEIGVLAAAPLGVENSLFIVADGLRDNNHAEIISGIAAGAFYMAAGYFCGRRVMQKLVMLPAPSGSKNDVSYGRVQESSKLTGPQ